MSDLLATSSDTWRDRAADAPVIPQELVPPREGTFTDFGFLGDELPSLSSGLSTTESLIAQKPELVRV